MTMTYYQTLFIVGTGIHHFLTLLTIWPSDNGIGCINEVTLRRV